MLNGVENVKSFILRSQFNNLKLFAYERKTKARLVSLCISKQVTVDVEAIHYSPRLSIKSFQTIGYNSTILKALVTI